MIVFTLKIVVVLVFITHACNADLSIKSQTLQQIDFSTSLRRAIQSNSCQDDLNLLDSNKDLAADLQNVTESFDAAFDLNPFDYCSGRKVGEAIEMECVVNYTDFAANYIERCNNLGGQPYPISLLMKCDSNDFDLDFQLNNVPSCLGRTCNIGEVYSAILKILRSTETSFSSSDNNLDCQFFHNYDSLADAPIAIEPETPQVELPANSASASAKSSVIVTTLSIIAGSLVLWH